MQPLPGLLGFDDGWTRWYREQVKKNGKKEIAVWGNGATFDNVIIANAYKAVSLDKPWAYRSDRCYRTMINTFQDVRKPDMQGTVHNALDDAKLQAKHLCMIFDKLNYSKVLVDASWAEWVGYLKNINILDPTQRELYFDWYAGDGFRLQYSTLAFWSIQFPFS